MNVEFTLKINKRDGKRVEGEVTQNEGRFRAEVVGTFDGVVLSIGMQRVLQGAWRNFEYQGPIIGEYGLLNMRGIKTNKIMTSGTIMLIGE